MTFRTFGVKRLSSSDKVSLPTGISRRAYEQVRVWPAKIQRDTISYQNDTLSRSRQSKFNDDLNGWQVFLDNRELRTPSKNSFVLPSFSLALAIGYEWANQMDVVKPLCMPLMGLASTAIDVFKGDPHFASRTLLEHFHTDTLCFTDSDPVSATKAAIGEDSRLFSHSLNAVCRSANSQPTASTRSPASEEPFPQGVSSRTVLNQSIKRFTLYDSLSRTPVHRIQQELFSLLISAFEKRYSLKVSTSPGGLEPPMHAVDTLSRIEEYTRKMSLWNLAALYTLTINLKSFILGMSVFDQSITVEAAWDAANIEALHQQYRWGSVEGEHDLQKSQEIVNLAAAKAFSILSLSS